MCWVSHWLLWGFNQSPELCEVPLALLPVGISAGRVQARWDAGARCQQGWAAHTESQGTICTICHEGGVGGV